MPKGLLNRCQPDSIREFRAAARQRSRDALCLASLERRTAAIYLWGYVAETALKAAYFQTIGYPETRWITPADLHGAKATAKTKGVAWGGNLHDIVGWAGLLVTTLAATPSTSLLLPQLGSELLGRARTIQRFWRETLRYHKNLAYPYEVAQVQASAEWLLVNSLYL